MSPRSHRPCSNTKYTSTLIAISAIVTIGSRRVGMSSLSGINSSAGNPLARGRRLCQRLLGVVTRAHQRTRRHRLEAHRVRLALELRELVGVPVAHDRKMVARRPQVLADRQHLDTVLAKDAERLEQLLLRLAEPGHEPGLRDD